MEKLNEKIAMMGIIAGQKATQLQKDLEKVNYNFDEFIDNLTLTHNELISLNDQKDEFTFDFNNKGNYQYTIKYDMAFIGNNFYHYFNIISIKLDNNILIDCTNFDIL